MAKCAVVRIVLAKIEVIGKQTAQRLVCPEIDC